MSEPFDPYYQWLGIAPKDQPPNYYRLLGIDLFESSPKVIQTAADRQMAHLRTFQTGQYSAESQRLLNEVARAKVVLLQPDKKAEYDKRLRAELEARGAALAAEPTQTAGQKPPVKPSGRAAIAADGRTAAACLAQQSAPKARGFVPRLLVLLGVASVLGIVVLWAFVEHFRSRAQDADEQAMVHQADGGAADDAAARQKPLATPSKPHRPVEEHAGKPGVQPGDKQPGGDKSQTTIGGQPSHPAPPQPEPQPPEKPSPPESAPGQPVQPADSPAQPVGPETKPPDSKDGRTVDLLRHVNLDRHVLAGDWQLGRQQLSTEGRQFARILMPAKPEGDYVWEVEFTRRGSGWLGLMFPVDGTTVYFEVGASGGKETGVGVIEGRRANDPGNPTRRPCEVKDNRKTSVMLVVRRSRQGRAEIKVFLNGLQYLAWQGPISSLSEDFIWRLPRKGVMAIGSMAPLEVHRSRLQMLSGQATLLDDPSQVAASVGPPRSPPESPIGPPSLPGLGEQPPKVERVPAPSAESLGQAQRLARELYGQEIQQAKTEQEKGKLARKLLEQSRLVRDDQAGRYVLLQMSQDLAVEAADGRLAMEALDRLAEQYELPFDPWDRKTEILAKVARNLKRAEDRKALVQFALVVIGQAQQDEAFSAAQELAKLAAAETSRLRDKQLSDEVRTITKDLAQAAKSFADAKTALEKLQSDPEDAAANRTAGQYYCFVKGDWQKGLPHLAKGADPGIREAAKADVALSEGQTRDAAARLRVADAWWDLAAKFQGPERDALRLRAGYWYKDVVDELESGLGRLRVEKRLEEIAQIDRPTPAGAAGKAHRVITNSIGMKLVYIPAGEFVMGSGEGDRDALSDEKPAHRVRITKPFYMGMYEVTQAEYQQVMGRNPSYYAPGGRGEDRITGQDTSRHPVETVYWKDAVTFCMRLSQLPAEMRAGRVYRLPTEAEWEYACRAGTSTAFFFGDNPNALQEYAWIGRNTAGVHRPVGTRKPNPWGLYDMYGNVGEWCSDWYDREYYKNSPLADPTGPVAGGDRVMRGGEYYNNDPRRFRSAARYPRNPGSAGPLQGFRVVMVTTK